jgi:hypothetical protein
MRWPSVCIMAFFLAESLALDSPQPFTDHIQNPEDIT